MLEHVQRARTQLNSMSTGERTVKKDLVRAYYLRGLALPDGQECVMREAGDNALCRHNHLRNGAVPLFAGAVFDLPSAQLSPTAFAENDLLRLSLLSVPIGSEVVRDLKFGFFDEPLSDSKNLVLNGLSLNQLLAGVSSQVQFEELQSDQEFDQQMGGSGPWVNDHSGQVPAIALWRALRSTSTARNWKLGDTRISKLIAAKRPNLVPIYDKFIGLSFGRTNADEHWNDLRGLLGTHLPSGEVNGLAKELKQITIDLQLDISVLRCLDVILWMAGSNQRAMTAAGHLYSIPSDCRP